MEKKWMILFLGLLILMGSGGVSGAQVVNGDFSNGLNGWTSEGNVQVINKEVRAGDFSVIYTFLFQGVSLPPGTYTIDFDFRNSLSRIVPQGTFPDTFFASLYFSNHLSQFDLESGGFDEAIALFDMDRNDLSNLHASATITQSSKGTGWSHFTLTFQNNFRHVIPVFEVFAENGINGDSAVLLDNIVITMSLPFPVSVPALNEWTAAALVLLMGISFLIFLRKPKRV